MKRAPNRGTVIVPITLLVSALFLGACGSDEPAGPSGGTTTATATATAAANVPGVTATEVVIGTHIALSGPQAFASQYGAGMKAYYDYVNSQGGVNGRKIVFEQKDDTYAPTTARIVTQELVEQRKVFAIVGGIGTPGHLAVVDYLNEQKVPDLFVLSNAAVFNNPSKYPYTFSVVPGGFAEAKAAAQYSNSNFASAKAGVLYQNDDFGKEYLRGFKETFKGTIVGERSYESTEQDTSSQTASLLSADADLLVLACLPVQCASAVRAARGAGSNAQLILAAPNAGGTIFQLVGGPQNLEGALVASFGKPDSQTDDPAVQKHIEIMKPSGVAPSMNTIYGQIIAELFVDTLKRAGQNPTRASLLEAAESINNFKSDLALSTGSTSKTDHYVWSGLQFLQVKSGKWTPVGSVVLLK
jgi:ABC-type branched-subunit amino acid transport system substrate-binding protein